MNADPINVKKQVNNKWRQYKILKPKVKQFEIQFLNKNNPNKQPLKISLELCSIKNYNSKSLKWE